MSRAAHSVRDLRFGLVLAWLVLAGSLTSSPAHAEENLAAVQKVTALNKKALEAYNNLDFEDARRILKQALELCSAAGLDRHPIKARTHIHMGVVLIATKQQDLGVKQFRKALEIQPDIRVTKSLANPEILQAFNEAAAQGPETADVGGAESSMGAGGAPSSGAPAPGGSGDIKLIPVTRGKRGKPVSISAAISPDLTGYTKVVLAYRAAGTTEFVGTEMRRAGSRFIGEIPAGATQGTVVHYYVEAEATDETPVATSGSEQRPYAVWLSAGLSRGEDGGAGESEGAAAGGPLFFLSLAGGSGYGYATGHGELNADAQVNPGFAPSTAAQIVPEVGYFILPQLRLSLQLRLQIVTGRTPLNLDQYVKTMSKINIDSCGTDHICSTGGPLAASVFARGSWFFGSGTFQPYVSFALGGGVIRHIVKFTSLGKVCGDKGDQTCVDSVLTGPIFLGPGGGLFIALNPTFGFIVELDTVLGFPKFTYHLDLNAGVAARF